MILVSAQVNGPHGGQGTGMEHTVTLSVLGRPIQFVQQRCRIEGCLTPVHKGPCKGTKKGVAKAVKKTAAKKAVPAKAVPKKPAAKKAAPKKAMPSAPEQTDADRIAQVKKMTSKPLHHGYKMAYVIDRLKKLANSFGGDFDRDRMMVRVTSKHGTGEMRMTPQGWQVNIARANSAPYTRNFRDVESAALQIQGLRFFQPPTPERR